MASPFDAQYSAIRDRIYHYADTYGINRNIAVWQIWRESKFDPGASSGKANGIVQMTPATAARFGVNVWDIESSLNGWGKYMKFLLNRFNSDYSLALAGYNAGEGNVDKYGGIPHFTETINYVEYILTNAGSQIVSTVAGNVAEHSNYYAVGAVLLLFLVLD